MRWCALTTHWFKSVNNQSSADYKSDDSVVFGDTGDSGDFGQSGWYGGSGKK